MLMINRVDPHRAKCSALSRRQNRRATQPRQWGLLRATVTCAAAAVLGACHSTETVCPEIAAFGISLTVVDSMTGAAPSTGSRVVVDRVGSVTDTVQNATTSNFYRIFGSGRINLRVITAGYRDWIDSGITVAVNSCQIPQTVQLTAKLQR